MVAGLPSDKAYLSMKANAHAAYTPEGATMSSLDKLFKTLSNHKTVLVILLTASIIFVSSLIATCTHLGLKYEIKGGVDIKIVSFEFKVSSDKAALLDKQKS